MATCGKCGASVSEGSSSCYSCGAKFKSDDLIDSVLALIIPLTMWVFMYLPFALIGLLVGLKAHMSWDWGWLGCSLIGLGAFALLFMLVYTVGLVSRLVPKPLNYLVRFIQFFMVSGLQMAIVFSIAIGYFLPDDIKKQFTSEGEATVQQLQSEGVTTDNTTTYLFKYAKSQTSTAISVLKGEYSGESRKGLIYSLLTALGVGLFVWFSYRSKNKDDLDE